MSIEIRARAPRPRCHRCGSREIAALCHHCGRPLCRKHSSKDFVTSEFDDLGNPDSVPQHCEEHKHVVKPPIVRFIKAGAAVAALGVVLMFLWVPGGLILLLAGLAGGALAWHENRSRFNAAVASRPPLPVEPSIDSVRVREVVRGNLTLDESGNYHSSMTPVEGEITVDMTFGRTDQNRLGTYREKFRLGSEQDVEFSAGYAVLTGRAGLQFADSRYAPPVLPLAGRVSEHPFLSAQDSRAGAKWRFRLSHRIFGGLDIHEIPLWLTPALVPESDQRALQLDLQWLGDWLSEEASLHADRVERLTLYVPVGWGNVESASEYPTVGRHADPVTGGRLIEWKQLSLGEGADHRLTLSVRFENTIELSDVITGSMVVSFNGALSGIKNIDFYPPMGGPLKKENRDSSVKTEVTADLSLSLSGVRYQDRRVVPDQKKDDLTERPESVSFPGVIPDHSTLIALTDAMSENGYYVKYVVGHSPRNGDQVNALKRAWDVGGRLYEGVYPVDFYVGLAGDEIYGGDIHAVAGSSKVRLSVNGAYATKEMEDRIKTVWHSLTDIVSETLELRKGPEPNGRAAEAPYRPRHSGPDDTERTTGTSELQRRRKDLRDAVMDGRISEQLFRQLDAELDSELAGADQHSRWDEED
ncbi:hypothetical protein ACFQ05_37405 [Amycolatopsis umgeniensis]|uniref:Uncharacterized protein n=1 Tax=Amycolatopsis umgeniensis TaxID=336628 RepID=A0A841AW30_9PSEU|nr:hypothetical protein [Amycolatopsis umgeniensis]MBB5851103.1 hypothetical protein [Amycolatopsis umgeniensis]